MILLYFIKQIVYEGNSDLSTDDLKEKIKSKEFSILEYLMRNANKILTKSQIINHVWNYNADVLPNTVEVNIKNLRIKIDKPFKNSKKLIITVRGFGYKIQN